MADHEEGFWGTLLRGLFGGFGNVNVRWGEGHSKGTSSKTIVYKKSVLKIIKNGEEQTLDTSAGVNDAELQQMAEHLGISVEALQNLRTGQGTLSAEDLKALESLEKPRTVRLAMSQQAVTCDKCQGKTIGRMTCQWCGAELTSGSTPVAEQVDQQFLKEDGLPETKMENHKQKVQQSFLRRLRGIDPEQSGK